MQSFKEYQLKCKKSCNYNIFMKKNGPIKPLEQYVFYYMAYGYKQVCKVCEEFPFKI